jgi:hypothetical protein
VLLPWIHFAFPLVVDTCVLQPPIATLGETASAPRVLPIGLVVRACWCVVEELNPGSAPVPTEYYIYQFLL